MESQLPRRDLGGPSLLETRGDELITIEGLTLPLRVWFDFCPIPHEGMDPLKIEEAAQAFLDGKNPFVQKELPGSS